jgi:CrcB protein
VVNVAGAFLLGLVVAGGGVRGALLGPGFCGALTTFSTLQLEVLQMLDDGRVALAVAYLAASLVVGLGAVELAGRRR